jgi:hypothetical protein
MIFGVIIGEKNQARWTDGSATLFYSTKTADARSPCPCCPDEDSLDDQCESRRTLLSSEPPMISFDVEYCGGFVRLQQHLQQRPQQSERDHGIGAHFAVR